MRVLANKETSEWTSSQSIYQEAQARLKEFFGNRLEDFMRYFASVGFSADFVAKKDGEFFIVKVKTQGGLRYLEKATLNQLFAAREYGFTPYLVTMALNFSVKEFKTESL